MLGHAQQIVNELDRWCEWQLAQHRLIARQIPFGNGAYDKVKNSCVTHVCETIKQGGADVPDSALGTFKYLKKLGF